MRIKFFIPVLIILLLVPMAARSADQETIDRFIFLLQQPEWDMWDDGVFDDATLQDGLSTIYDQAVADGNDILYRRVVWAMGVTGLLGFVPTVTDALNTEGVVACYALGKLSSEDSVTALIGMLDNDDMHVRDAAVWGLGNIEYTSGMEDAQTSAVDALNDRLAVEEEDWIRESIDSAVVLIETGIITDEMFMEPVDPI